MVSVEGFGYSDSRPGMAPPTDYRSVRSSRVQACFTSGTNLWCRRAGGLRTMRPAGSVSSRRRSPRDLRGTAAKVYQFAPGANRCKGDGRIAPSKRSPRCARTGCSVTGFCLPCGWDDPFDPKWILDEWQGWPFLRKRARSFGVLAASGTDQRTRSSGIQPLSQYREWALPERCRMGG
jgi:hypothetical protein